MAILALTRDTIHSLTNMLIWNEGPCYSIYVTFPPCSPVDALEEAEEKLNDFSMYVWITLTSFQTGKKCRIESTFKRAQILLPSFDICAVLWPFRAYLYLFLVFALPEFCVLFFKAKDQFILFSSIPAFSSSLWVFKKKMFNEFMKPLNLEVGSLYLAHLSHSAFGFTAINKLWLHLINSLVDVAHITLQLFCPEFSFILIFFLWKQVTEN